MNLELRKLILPAGQKGDAGNAKGKVSSTKDNTDDAGNAIDEAGDTRGKIKGTGSVKGKDGDTKNRTKGTGAAKSKGSAKDASSTQSASSAAGDAASRRLLIGWIPILIVALALLWLEGGIPPTSWRLLIEMLLRWRDLQAFMGGSAFLSLFIVFLQSFLVLAAWVALGWAVRHEISVFSMVQAQQRILRLQEQAGQSAVVPAVQDAAASPPVLQDEQVTLEDVELDLSQDDDDLTEQEEAVANARQNAIQDEPFDSNTAIFELPAEPEEDVEDEASSPRQVQEEETKFVFGDPFEGELPEVFEYDQDLKRSVQDLHEHADSEHPSGKKQSGDLSSDQSGDQSSDQSGDLSEGQPQGQSEALSEGQPDAHIEAKDTQDEEPAGQQTKAAG